MKLQRYWVFLVSLCFTLFSVASEQKAEEPLFKDGKGYFSYKTPLNIPLPKEDKILITYFYQYGCEVCLNGDDYIKQYVARHQDKVVLERIPVFTKENGVTITLNAIFDTLGRTELSERYLFDSAYQKDKLIKNNQAITEWLAKNGITLEQINKIHQSEDYLSRIKQTHQQLKLYSPPTIPMAVLNGKYILTRSTLYNDDYTYAVLDFLIDKLQKEQQGVTK